MKIGSRIIIFSLLAVIFFAAGCKGRKNRCATCPTWSYEKVEMNTEEFKG